MKVPINLILENAQKGDQVEYSGKIKTVFPFKDKPTKWSIGNQTLVVKDNSGEINTVMSIKNDHAIYDKDIEGKEVVISGTLSEWEGKKNVFGKKLSFTDDWQPEDKPKANNPKSNSQGQQVSYNITPEQIRIECLKATIQFLGNEQSADTKEIIANAKLFEKYITGNKIEGAVNTPQKAMEKAGLLKEKNEEKPDDPDLAEKVKKINCIMELAEELGENGEARINDFIAKCGQEDIKELTLKQLEILLGKLETTPPDESKIPF